MRRLLLALPLAFLLALVLPCATRAASGDAAAPAGAGAEAAQVLVLIAMPPAHYRPDAHYAGGYADAAGSAARQRIAAALARSNGLTLATDWPMPVLGLDCYVMNVPASRQAEEVALELARDRRVAWAQPMQVFRSLARDEPVALARPTTRAWPLDVLHVAATGRDVRVAVVDSAVEADHPDLAGQVAERADFVGDRAPAAEVHGTAVAGILAARPDSRVGLAGVAPQARLLALRACRQSTPTDTVCSTLGLALGLHAAIERGAQVINLSLSGPPDRLIARLLEVAVARGVGVVAAADRTRPQGGFPAAQPGVVGVVDSAGGPTPAGLVAAPGSDLPTTLPGGRWGTVSGASYAAAQVSGLVALMVEARGTRTAAPRAVGGDLVVGADGRIDACASLLKAGARCACDCPADRLAATDARR